MSSEKKVQVCPSDESHIDREFRQMRDKFDEQMKKMEEEMSLFRGSVADKHRELQSRSLSPGSRADEMSAFVDNYKSPLIRETSDGKTLKLKFDVHDYEPEEIFVKTVENKLQVSEQH